MRIKHSRTRYLDCFSRTDLRYLLTSQPFDGVRRQFVLGNQFTPSSPDFNPNTAPPHSNSDQQNCHMPK